MMYGVIYCLTSPSGKCYIGQTTNYPRRMAVYSYAGCKSQPYLYQAIVKHGWKNFTQDIIGVAYSRAELDQLEVDAIAAYRATECGHGYNLCTGGRGRAGFTHSAEARIKIGLASKIRIHKPHSAITRAKLVEAWKHRAPASSATRAKLSEANKRSVTCVSTGITYCSIGEASAALGVADSGITRCCRGRQQYAGKLPDGTKLQWRYA